MKLTSEIEKMIGKVMKGRECKRDEAIAYMLGVATGRLNALNRYADSLPEGKASKGVRIAGKRKPAERVKPFAKPAEPKAAASA